MSCVGAPKSAVKVFYRPRHINFSAARAVKFHCIDLAVRALAYREEWLLPAVNAWTSPKNAFFVFILKFIHSLGAHYVARVYHAVNNRKVFVHFAAIFRIYAFFFDFSADYVGANVKMCNLVLEAK